MQAVGDAAPANNAFTPIFNKQPAHGDLLSATLCLVRYLGMTEAERDTILNSKNKIIIWGGVLPSKPNVPISHYSSVKSPTNFRLKTAVKYIEGLKKAYSTKSNSDAAADFGAFLDKIVELWELFAVPRAIDVDVISLVENICSRLNKINTFLFPAALAVKYNLLLALKFSIDHGFTTVSWSNYDLERIAKLKDLDEKCRQMNPEYTVITVPKKHRLRNLLISSSAASINIRRGWKKQNLIVLLEFICEFEAKWRCIFCGFLTSKTADLQNHFQSAHSINFDEIFARQETHQRELQNLTENLNLIRLD